MNASQQGPVQREGASATIIRAPRLLILDDFLPAPLLSDLLEFTLENEDAFEPAEVVRDGAGRVDPAVRRSGLCKLGLGPHEAAFEKAIHARYDDIASGLGLTPFALASTELQLVAHGDNAFYKPHIDTLVGVSAASKKSVRVVSCVYYFHREPKRFTGGEIAIYPFGKDEKTEVVKPVQNRLLAFPSFARHEVREVISPSGTFADSRFAINCWLRKERGTPHSASVDRQPGGS